MFIYINKIINHKYFNIVTCKNNWIRHLKVVIFTICINLLIIVFLIKCVIVKNIQ